MRKHKRERETEDARLREGLQRVPEDLQVRRDLEGAGASAVLDAQAYNPCAAHSLCLLFALSLCLAQTVKKRGMCICWTGRWAEHRYDVPFCYQ